MNQIAVDMIRLDRQKKERLRRELISENSPIVARHFLKRAISNCEKEKEAIHKRLAQQQNEY